MRPLDIEGSGNGAATGRRAKVVCTLGPATESREAIGALVDAGMDVARLNFSHGTREDHAAVYGRVREASQSTRRAVGILGDLQGPKIRLGRFEGGFAVLEEGELFTVMTEPTNAGKGSGGSRQQAGTTYGGLATDVAAGDTLLIDDGLVKLSALSTDGVAVRCRVVEGGIVSDHKGINLPGVAVATPAMTDKDADDLRFALALGVDMVALSFVRSPEDARTVHRVMDDAGRRVPVLAKIEKPEAVDSLEAICDAFDGLMVARGDLGVEIPLERVPMVQKRAVRVARDQAKPVIVATQMLESMTRCSRPTRAEVADVANAVTDGADAVMLSAETSIGDHPHEAVATMVRIITEAEREGLRTDVDAGAAPSTPEAIALVAPALARTVGASALVAFTQTGASARRLASQRSAIPLLAFTSSTAVRSQLALTWGVEAFIVPPAGDTEEMVAQVDRVLLEGGWARAGERIVIVAGSLAGRTGSTDTVRVVVLGDGGGHRS